MGEKAAVGRRPLWVRRPLSEEGRCGGEGRCVKKAAV